MSFIDKIIEKHSDVLVFRNDSEREKWINDLNGLYQALDDKTIITRKNRQSVDFATVEQDALQRAKPGLKARTTSKYLPKFVDPRTSEQRLKQSQDVAKLVDFYFEKMGIAFKNEHLGDMQIRGELKDFIAKNFLYEAGDLSGTIVFRKHHQGMFGPPFNPVDLINQLAAPYIDHKKKADNEFKIEKQLQAKILDRMGLSSVSQLSAAQRTRFDDELKEVKANELLSYTTKKLPVANRDEYREEFQLRALHKTGLTDSRFANHNERMNIESMTQQGLQNLENIPNFEIPGYTGRPKFSPWDGLENVTNDTGYFLGPEDL